MDIVKTCIKANAPLEFDVNSNDITLHSSRIETVIDLDTSEPLPVIEEILKGYEGNKKVKLTTDVLIIDEDKQYKLSDLTYDIYYDLVATVINKSLPFLIKVGKAEKTNILINYAIDTNVKAISINVALKGDLPLSLLKIQYEEDKEHA